MISRKLASPCWHTSSKTKWIFISISTAYNLLLETTVCLPKVFAIDSHEFKEDTLVKRVWIPMESKDLTPTSASSIHWWHVIRYDLLLFPLLWWRRLLGGKLGLLVNNLSPKSLLSLILSSPWLLQNTPKLLRLTPKSCQNLDSSMLAEFYSE